MPASGASGVARDANVSITFSEPVNATGSWFSISCATSGAHTATASGGPLTFTLDPAVDFAVNESCTVTVSAASVTDQDAEDPPDTMAADHVFTFQTEDVLVCGDPATRIHQIQGEHRRERRWPATPVTIEGVVVGDYQAPTGEFGGYYVQEEDGDVDTDPLTSEGIFVFANGFGARRPARRRRSRPRHGRPSSRASPRSASVNAVEVCSTGASVASAAVSLPVAAIGDLERFEGMQVSFYQTLTATEVFNLGRFGEVSLSGVGRLYNPTAVVIARRARAGAARREQPQPDHPRRRQQPAEHRPDALPAGRALRDQHAPRRRHAARPHRRHGLPVLELPDPADRPALVHPLRTRGRRRPSRSAGT